MADNDRIVIVHHPLPRCAVVVPTFLWVGGRDRRLHQCIELGVLNTPPQVRVRTVRHQPHEAQEHVVAWTRATGEKIPFVFRQCLLIAKIVIGFVFHFKAKHPHHLQGWRHIVRVLMADHAHRVLGRIDALLGQDRGGLF